MNNSGSESPRPSRKRFGSASEETILKQVNGDGGLSLANPQELDNLRAEIIREMRIEINKAKQEILDGEWLQDIFYANFVRIKMNLFFRLFVKNVFASVIFNIFAFFNFSY